MKKTYLKIPQEMWAHAKQHGALFDRDSRQHFVVGDVPLELVNFLPRSPPSARRHIVPPICPVCQSHTKLITETKNGSWFYGCSRHFSNGCPGSVDYELHLEAIGESSDISAIAALKGKTQRETANQRGGKKPNEPLADELKEKIEEIAKIGIDILGGTNQFNVWIAKPKVALKGNTPLQAMFTLDGCEKVEALLRTIQ